VIKDPAPVKVMSMAGRVDAVPVSAVAKEAISRQAALHS